MERETVHHIDLDPTNNALENLHLYATEQEHMLAHRNIETLIKPLIDRGVIVFKDGRYLLTSAVAVTFADTREQ